MNDLEHTLLSRSLVINVQTLSFCFQNFVKCQRSTFIWRLASTTVKIRQYINCPTTKHTKYRKTVFMRLVYRNQFFWDSGLSYTLMEPSRDVSCIEEPQEISRCGSYQLFPWKVKFSGRPNLRRRFRFFAPWLRLVHSCQKFESIFVFCLLLSVVSRTFLRRSACAAFLNGWCVTTMSVLSWLPLFLSGGFPLMVPFQIIIVVKCAPQLTSYCQHEANIAP